MTSFAVIYRSYWLKWKLYNFVKPIKPYSIINFTLIHAGMMIFSTLYIWTEFPCVWWGWFYSPSQWMLSVWFGANCHLTLYLYGRGVDSTDYRLIDYRLYTILYYRLWSVSPSVSPHAGDTESCTAQRSYRVTGQMDRCFLGSRGRATTRQSL